MDEYNEKRKLLLQNSQLLLERSLDIAKKEYRKKVAATKLAILEYTLPHKDALDELREKIKHIKKALERIEVDKEILQDDASKIKKALETKLEEMNNIEMDEIKKIEDISFFIEEIKKAKERFEYIIAILEQKLMKIYKRNDYLEILGEMDLNIPKLKDVFKELSDDFGNRIKEIDNAFFLLGLSFNQNLIESIEKQKQMNTILGIKNKTISSNSYDFDLNFLNIETQSF